MGERHKDALRVTFDRKVKLEFHGSKLTSDGGLLINQELDEAFRFEPDLSLIQIIAQPFLKV